MVITQTTIVITQTTIVITQTTMVITQTTMSITQTTVVITQTIMVITQTPVVITQTTMSITQTTVGISQTRCGRSALLPAAGAGVLAGGDSGRRGVETTVERGEGGRAVAGRGILSRPLREMNARKAAAGGPMRPMVFGKTLEGRQECLPHRRRGRGGEGEGGDGGAKSLNRPQSRDDPCVPPCLGALRTFNPPAPLGTRRNRHRTANSAPAGFAGRSFATCHCCMPRAGRGGHPRALPGTSRRPRLRCHRAW